MIRDFGQGSFQLLRRIPGTARMVIEAGAGVTGVREGCVHDMGIGNAVIPVRKC